MDQEQLVEKRLELLVTRADLAHPLRHQPDQWRYALRKFATTSPLATFETPQQVVDHLHRNPEFSAFLAIAQRRRAQVPQPHAGHEFTHRVRRLVPIEPLAQHLMQALGDLLLTLAIRSPRIVAPVASPRRLLQRAPFAHHALDQLAHAARGTRVFLLDLLRHHRRARLQGAGDDFDCAHDRVEPAIQLATARDVLRKCGGDRTEVLDQATQRTRIVAKVGRVEQRQRDHRLLQSPDQWLGSLGQAAIVDHVVEHRRNHVDHRDLRRRRPGFTQAGAHVAEELAARLTTVGHGADRVGEGNGIALDIEYRLQDRQHAQVLACGPIGQRRTAQGRGISIGLHQRAEGTRGITGLFGRGALFAPGGFALRSGLLQHRGLAVRGGPRGCGRQRARRHVIGQRCRPGARRISIDAGVGLARLGHAGLLETPPGRFDSLGDRCGECLQCQLPDHRARARVVGQIAQGGERCSGQRARAERVDVVISPPHIADGAQPRHVARVGAAGTLAHQARQVGGENLGFQFFIVEQRQGIRLVHAAFAAQVLEATQGALREGIGNACHPHRRLASQARCRCEQ